MADTRKAPPAWLIDGIGRVRKLLTVASRSAVPANVALLEMATGAWLTQALYVAVKLGLADALRDGPRSADDVARQVGADPGATYRVMRALTSNGVLELRRDGRFALTRIGQALRSDYEGSMAPMIALIGTAEHWEHWGSLLYSVQTGQTAIEKIRGLSAFDYLDTNREYAAVFNDAMTGMSTMAIQTTVPLYDFTDRKLIVDVGGRNIRTAITADGKLLLFEMVLPEGAPPHPGMLLDLEMLVHAGGRERTPLEYGDLLSRGGFRLTRVIPTPGPMSIVEAVPA